MQYKGVFIYYRGGGAVNLWGGAKKVLAMQIGGAKKVLDGLVGGAKKVLVLEIYIYFS